MIMADALMTGERLAVVSNVIDIQCSLPKELMRGCFLVRATPDEIERIDAAEDRGSQFPFTAQMRRRMIPVSTATPQGTQTAFYEGPAESWRYFVIRFQGSEHPIMELEQATHVSRAPLEFPLTLLQGGLMFNYSHLAGSFPTDGIPVYGDGEVEDAIATYLRIEEIKAAHPEVARAVRMYHALKLLPPNSEFHVLGLFAIIELLLTHQPENKEIGDSLRHQLRTKIPLIVRRAADGLDYNNYFDVAVDSVLWARLYDVRSALAHGGEPTFTGSFQVLRHLPAVQKFLRHATWVLIRHTLNEPKLVQDLRRC